MHFLQDPPTSLDFLSKSFSSRFTEKAMNKHFLATHEDYFLSKTFFSQVNNKGLFFWWPLSLTATSGAVAIIVSVGHVHFSCTKEKNGNIQTQFGYRKWGTHVRVFSQTLEHGNSTNKWNKTMRRKQWRIYILGPLMFNFFGGLNFYDD